jgi:hypothetical protein
MHVGSVYQGENLSEITSSITFEKRVHISLDMRKKKIEVWGSG